MKIIRRGQVTECHIEPHDADHRLQLARALLGEIAPRSFVGMPEDWQRFVLALQGIEGGNILLAGSAGLEPAIPAGEYAASIEGRR